MTARNAMIHRCNIQRDTRLDVSSVTDEWGNPLPFEWENTSEVMVSCRYWYNLSDTVMDSEKRVVQSEYFLHLPIDTDVNPNDRIGNITDRRGQVLVAGPMRIDELGPHERDHLVAKLHRIT